MNYYIYAKPEKAKKKKIDVQYILQQLVYALLIVLAVAWCIGSVFIGIDYGKNINIAVLAAMGIGWLMESVLK